MKNKIKTTIIFILVICLVFIPSEAKYRPLHDPRVDNWDAVQDWEVDVCSKWGGTGRAQSVYLDQERETRVSQLEVSLQAYVQRFPDGRQFYEVAWYVKPASGEIEYRVTFEGEDPLEAGSGSAEQIGGDTGYFGITQEGLFTRAKIDYTIGELTVPIVVKEEP